MVGDVQSVVRLVSRRTNSSVACTCCCCTLTKGWMDGWMDIFGSSSGGGGIVSRRNWWTRQCNVDR